jgi:hypothetical protein
MGLLDKHMCHCLLTTLRVKQVHSSCKTKRKIQTTLLPFLYNTGEAKNLLHSWLQLTEISNKQFCPYISYQRISHIKNNKKKCLIIVVVVVVVGLESLKF